MQADERLEDLPAEPRPTRWIPSSLLDLPPLEPVFALRTPHRIYLQAMPSSREALRAMLQVQPFEISIEIDDESAPLRHVPVQDVHEVKLAANLALPWDHYYWIADGLQDDLTHAIDNPGMALAAGRRRLAVVEEVLGSSRRRSTSDLGLLVQAWAERKEPFDLGIGDEDVPTATQYVQDLVRHMVSRTNSRAFGDWMADLAQEATHHKVQGIPSLSAAEQQALGTYLQHRTLGNVALASPAGMVAGWQLVMSTALLGTWFAGLLVHSGYEHEMDEALVASLWMLDQGFWCDESLVHEVLRYVQTRGLTTPALAQALTTALAGAPSRI
ncbi:MAG TPA: hypothetical protein VFD07_03790 [Candidatus Krumholzibacteria bacterium]|nr:hypothetical protein [Candidatus Krumholzibacteria bacterium]